MDKTEYMKKTEYLGLNLPTEQNTYDPEQQNENMRVLDEKAKEIDKAIEGKQEKLKNPLTQADVVDNLNSTSSSAPLSANQGKLLAEAVGEKMQQECDIAENTVTFTSSDSTTATAWTDVAALTSGEKNSSIFNKISTMFKNIRYLYARLSNHDGAKNNPHGVTKSQVGLGNVDNTADSNKSVKYAATAGSATSATKATQDGSGNNIVNTYAKKNNNTDANGLMNALTVGTSDPTDSDYYISQYAGGGTTNVTYHRRPLSALWSWIKGKLATVATTGNYSDLKGTPTQMPASDVYSWAKQSTKPSYTASEVGALSSNGNAVSATKASKLSNTSAIGSATKPVYFTANGVPSACTYSIGKSVPSDAKFTDTNTWRPVQNNLTSTSTTDCLSAYQGKLLNDSLSVTNSALGMGVDIIDGQKNNILVCDDSTVGRWKYYNKVSGSEGLPAGETWGVGLQLRFDNIHIVIFVSGTSGKFYHATYNRSWSAWNQH